MLSPSHVNVNHLEIEYDVIYIPAVKTNAVPVFAQKAACVMVTPCSSGHADSVSSSIRKGVLIDKINFM